MLENKEFKIEKDIFEDNSFEIMNQHYPWHCFGIEKDQIDALIDILNQLKEETDNDRKTGNI